jgi:hypothetical protein
MAEMMADSDGARIREAAAQLPLPESVARVEAARTRLEAAARSLSADEFASAGKETLAAAAYGSIQTAQQVLYVALSGELPPDGDVPALPGDLDGLLSEHKAAMESLYIHMDDADPEAFLECTWRHPDLGELNWREWLLAIADALDEGAKGLEGLHAG